MSMCIVAGTDKLGHTAALASEQQAEDVVCHADMCYIQSDKVAVLLSMHILLMPVLPQDTQAGLSRLSPCPCTRWEHEEPQRCLLCKRCWVHSV